MKKSFILLIAVFLLNTVVAQNWEEIKNLPFGSSANLKSVKFTDSNTGYSVGVSGTILKSIDGGIHWTKQTSGTTQILNSIYFTDANTGYIVGNARTILKSTNAGTQ